MSRIVKKMLFCGAKSFPEGHVIRVYVGKDDDTLRKFEMEANYLNHPLFESLLRLSAEEIGFSYSGALRICCDIDLFRYLIDLLETRNPSAHYMELSELICKFYGGSSDRCRLPGSVTTFGQLLTESR